MPAAALDAAPIKSIGILAGGGMLPQKLLEACDQKGIEPFVIGFEGQTDLMTLVHAFSNNLTLASGDLVASNLSPMPGETVNISATVRNSGDFAINPVTLTFYDGDPNIGGTQIGAQTLPGALSAGMSATVTISYLTPLQLAPRALIVIGDAANQIAESNEGDNRAEIAIYSPDLALQELGIH